MLNSQLLEILCCPKCKADVSYQSDKNRLVCTSCKQIYRIEDDIPIMIVEEDQVEKNESAQ